MNENWQKRTYPITFQICTASKFDRVELYGTFGDHHWKEPRVQLNYAHRKNSNEFVYSGIVHLIPGDYEYKYYVNQKDWRTNSAMKMKKENNLLTKNDFVQMIIDRYDSLEKKRTE